MTPNQAIIKAIDRSKLHSEPVVTKEGIQTRRWELNVPDESEIKKCGHNFISIWDLKKKEDKPVEPTKPVASPVSQANVGDTWGN